MFRSIFTNSFGILFSRILGFIRDLLTASVLGANIYSDIFFIAFKLPNLFRRIFAEGAFTQSFIPAFTRSRHKAVFSVHIFVLFLFVIMLITMMVNLFPHASAKAIALGFDEQTIALAAPFVAINFFYLPLIFAVTFFSTFLQYKHHFATTAFATGLLNIALIIALLLSQNESDDVIVTYLSYGVVLGGILQLIVHVIAVYRVGLSPLLTGGVRYYKKKSAAIKEESRRFSKQFFPAIWGNSTAQFSAFLDTWLASFLSTGVISYLYYANRVFQLPLALFAIATSIALFPRIARYLKHDNEKDALGFMKKAFWFLAFLLTASTIGGFILSEEITQLLFERGAFEATDTANTALILQMYMIGLLPFGINKLLVLWLYAQNRQMQAAKIATLSLSANIIFSLLLISPLGGAGLALASTISGFVAFAATVRAFGKERFLAIISRKYAMLWLLSALSFTVVVLYAKELIHVYL
ncbi:MAG: murein biosynthesis integral membrane protein MurJ [Epsilonproteobacteria bacterium]|nr:MAG: murein biosynthesis integral membrane protein MurJ [Campylobacterota bacterium]